MAISRRVGWGLLIALALLAAGLRATGFTRGTVIAADGTRQLHAFHPDEATLLRAARRLRNPLQPPITAYGLLPVYLARAGLAVADAGGAAGREGGTDPRTVLTGRALAVLISMATWLVLVAIAWRHLTPAVAVVAGALAAAPPLALQSAHFYTVDGSFALLFLLVLWATAAALRTPGWRRYLLVGVLVGLAGSVRLNGLTLGLLLLAGHLGRDGLRAIGPALRSLLVRDLWLAGAAALVTFLALQPYVLVHPELLTQVKTTDDFAFSVAVARGEILRPWTLADVDTTPYLHFWTALWPQSVGWPLTILLTAAIIWGIWRGGRLRWLLLGGCALCFLPVGGLHTKHVRYLLPLLAPLALLAADLLMAVWNADHPGARDACEGRDGQAGRGGTVGSRSWPLAAVVVGGVVVVATWVFGIAFTRVYTEEDARLTARRWIRDAVPPGSRIAVEGGGFSMEGLIDGTRHVEDRLSTAPVLMTRGYHTCRSVARYLAGQLSEVDWIALLDVNRYRQYTAAPHLVPGLASCYRRLLDGQLGFEPVQRFKVYPRWAGLTWKDDVAEVSYLGYDHPAVYLLRRQPEAAAALQAWQDGIAAEAACPDRYLGPVVEALVSDQPRRALELAAAAPDDAAPGLMSLLRSRGYHQLGDLDAEQAELNRFSAAFNDLSLSPELIPWASASSLIWLEMPDLARSILHFGAKHRQAFLDREAMMASYLYVGDLFAERGEDPWAEEAYRLAVQVHVAPLSLNRAAERAAARGEVDEALTLWRHSLQLEPEQEEVQRRVVEAARDGGPAAGGTQGGNAPPTDAPPTDGR